MRSAAFALFAAFTASAAVFAAFACACAAVFDALPPTIDFHHAPTPPALFVVSFVPAFALATRSLRLARCGSTDLDLI